MILFYTKVWFVLVERKEKMLVKEMGVDHWFAKQRIQIGMIDFKHTVFPRIVSAVFRRLMKGKFDAYVLWPLTKMFPKANSFRGNYSRKYGIQKQARALTGPSRLRRPSGQSSQICQATYKSKVVKRLIWKQLIFSLNQSSGVRSPTFKLDLPMSSVKLAKRFKKAYTH